MHQIHQTCEERVSVPRVLAYAERYQCSAELGESNLGPSENVLERSGRQAPSNQTFKVRQPACI